MPSFAGCSGRRRTPAGISPHADCTTWLPPSSDCGPGNLCKRALKKLSDMFLCAHSRTRREGWECRFENRLPLGQQAGQRLSGSSPMIFPSQSRSLAFASLLSLSLLSAYAVRAQEKTPDPKPTQPAGDTPKPSETPTSDKVLLRQIYRKGDVSETDQGFTMSMEMQATVGGNSIPAGSVTGTSHENNGEE